MHFVHCVVALPLWYTSAVCTLLGRRLKSVDIIVQVISDAYRDGTRS